MAKLAGNYNVYPSFKDQLTDGFTGTLCVEQVVGPPFDAPLLKSLDAIRQATLAASTVLPAAELADMATDLGRTPRLAGALGQLTAPILFIAYPAPEHEHPSNTEQLPYIKGWGVTSVIPDDRVIEPLTIAAINALFVSPPVLDVESAIFHCLLQTYLPDTTTVVSHRPPTAEMAQFLKVLGFKAARHAERSVGGLTLISTLDSPYALHGGTAEAIMATLIGHAPQLSQARTVRIPRR